MAQELIYTSAPRGLRVGSSGFCTVACTRGMAPNYAELLESLSGYAPVHPVQHPRASLNPVAFAHWRFEIGGKPAHVLSRVAFAGADYSGRSNKFAHHVVLSPEERPEGGPAWLMLRPGFMLERWGDEPGFIDRPHAVPQGDDPPGPCDFWLRCAGDAGWAGVLAQAFLDAERRPSCVLFEPGAPMLELLREALRLLPPPLRWQVTFNTYFTTLPAGASCAWRCCLKGSDALRHARRTPGAVLVDLTGGGGHSAEALRLLGSGSPLVAAAREGREPSVPPNARGDETEDAAFVPLGAAPPNWGERPLPPPPAQPPNPPPLKRPSSLRLRDPAPPPPPPPPPAAAPGKRTLWVILVLVLLLLAAACAGAWLAYLYVKSEISDLAGKNIDLLLENTKFQSELAAAKTRIEEMQDDGRPAEEREALQGEIARLKSEKRRLAASNEGYQGRIADLEESVARLEEAAARQREAAAVRAARAAGAFGALDEVLHRLEDGPFTVGVPRIGPSWRVAAAGWWPGDEPGGGIGVAPEDGALVITGRHMVAGEDVPYVRISPDNGVLRFERAGTGVRQRQLTDARLDRIGWVECRGGGEALVVFFNKGRLPPIALRPDPKTDGAPPRRYVGELRLPGELAKTDMPVRLLWEPPPEHNARFTARQRDGRFRIVLDVPRDTGRRALERLLETEASLQSGRIEIGICALRAER